MDLNGRVALITGGARRIGRATALRLARGGMRLALHYHTSAAAADQTAAECRALGHDAQVFAADLADPTACRALVADVLAHFGQLDAVINNAAVFERMSLEQLAVPAWDHTLRVNLTAPLLIAQAARSALKTAGGRIVNLCDAGTHRPWPGYLAYMASKAGLEAMTLALARALAPEIGVVGVAPGVADWPSDFDAEQRARLTARIPLRRAGTPEDIAETIHFLLRDGDSITGVIVPVDGGLSLT